MSTWRKLEEAGCVDSSNQQVKESSMLTHDVMKTFAQEGHGGLGPDVSRLRSLLATFSVSIHLGCYNNDIILLYILLKQRIHMLHFGQCQ